VRATTPPASDILAASQRRERVCDFINNTAFHLQSGWG
jgi:hypothetical protein